MPCTPCSESSCEMTRAIGTGATRSPASMSPTCTCRPRLRSELTDAAEVSAPPSASRETCAPPPVASSTASTPPARASTAASAPSCRARPSFSRSMSTATTRAPHAADLGPGRDDRARELVPGHVGRRDVRVVPLPRVPVRAADPRGPDLDHDAVARRRRIGYLLHGERPAVLVEDGGAQTRRRLGAGEPAPGRGRGALVQPDAVAVAPGERLVDRVRVRARPLRLELRQALRGELARVLLLDPLEPLGAGGLLVDVHVDALGLRVLVDLLEELVDEVLLRDLLERLAAREDEALVLGPGDTEVRVRRLPDAVDRAAEHGDLDRVGVRLEALLDVGHDGVHVELQAAAGRAGDQDRPALAQLERLEDLPGDLDLLLRVEGGERDADRVADPVREQRAEADRALERARPLRARLGDAEVQRVRDPLGEQAVRGDRVRHVRRLDRDLEVGEVEPLHQLDELDAGLNEGLDGVLALELVQVLGQRAGVDADPHRRAGRAGFVGALCALLGTADVAR